MAEKNPERAAVLERILEYEKNGWFDRCVENDPPVVPLNHEEIDFFRRKFSSKVKTKVAYFAGFRYFKKVLRTKELVLTAPRGLENLEGFDGGAIITCNHCHMFDHLVVLAGLKQHFRDLKNNRLWKIVREGNYSLPGSVGFLMRNADTLPVGDDGGSNIRLTAKSIACARELLKKGKKILVYPEQALWWNYRKPRPLKNGAFTIAAKNGAPIIPCFITMRDTDMIGPDGFNVQEFTLHVLPVIRPDANLTDKENCEMMRGKNTKAWNDLYERVYGK